ncbi:unnamed protein product [Paramecium pentaurelia]|uniref:Transmembrane protein n=1 Tax=Paramecium pentaurelia TaxID=43138 RepID=A0A8S1T8S6_9CILI|nr:unnamed protein product [Paramecium pentaurelia]
MDQKDQEEQTFKNFIKNNLLVFFTYNPKVHKSLNYSRIYNSYWYFRSCANNFSQCGIQCNQVIITNYIFYHINLHNNSNQLYDKNRKQLLIFLIFYNIDYNYSFDRNSSHIFYSLKMIKVYELHTMQSEDACQSQYILYYIWFLIMGIYFIFRSIGVYLAYVAYKFLRAKHNIEETKKKRKLRYMEMYKEKEQKKGEIQNQKYGDRKL